MIRMMRRNVLVDTGKLKAPWESNVIVCPDAYQRKQVKGKIVGIGPQCKQVSQSDVGKEAIFKAQHAYDLELGPAQSKQYGLNESYHMIVFEDDLISFL